MNDLEKLIKEIKGMDKKTRQKLLNSLASDSETVSKISGLLEDEAIQKKLRDILG